MSEKALTPEELAARSAAIDRLRNDPFPYTHIAVGLDLLLTLSGRYPDYFPAEQAVDVFQIYLKHTLPRLAIISPAQWSQGLRQVALNRLKQLCDNCTRCELAQYRLPGRSVFYDGYVDPDLLVVAEGPGNNEQRTGIPLVGADELRSSVCVKCHHYEECYLDPQGNYLQEPQRPCTPNPMAEIHPDQLRYRIAKRPMGLNTAGEHMDRMLKENRFLRKGYVQLLKMNEELGTVPPGSAAKHRPTVGVTNGVRCRCLKPEGPGGRLKNTTPSVAELTACNPWLQMTVELAQPRRILIVGVPALKAMRAQLPTSFKITEACHPSIKEPCVVPLSDRRSAYVTLHPASIMREQNEAAKQILFAKATSTVRAIGEDLARENAELQAINQRIAANP